MAKEKELQEKYLMLQLLDAQIKEIEKELAALENRNAELIKLKASLESLGNIKAGAKTYAPLGLGIYSQGTVSNNNEVLVNVGSGVIINKDIKSAKELLDSQLQQSEEVILKLVQNLQTLAARAHEMEHEINDLGAK